MRWLLALASAITPCFALATGPAPDDFARGLRLHAQAGKPVQQLHVPDAVYAGVTRADLGDLRVFNAASTVIPHALCPPVGSGGPTIKRQPLPVYLLRSDAAAAVSGQIIIETQQGAFIRIDPPDSAQGKRRTVTADGDVSAYIMDARGLPGTLTAIRVRWRPTTDASEIVVRVQASADLQDWRTIVATATLLHAEGGGAALEKNKIVVPPGNYQYLRLESRAQDLPPRIETVVAEIRQSDPVAEPITITVQSGTTGAESDAVFVYDSHRMAPMHAAELVLPADNMSLIIALDSRANPKGAWRQRWRGEVYRLAGVSRPENWSPMRFEETTDRYWRVRVLKGAESLADHRPSLRLTYYPQRLRFLAQGDPPYLLAFGSARVTPATPGCARLLGEVPEDRFRQMIGRARVVAGGLELGGKRVLNQPAEPIPITRYLLWAVLVFGAAALLGMALSLLRRLRK